MFSPLFEEMIPIDKYFLNGLKPPTRKLMKHIPPPPAERGTALDPRLQEPAIAALASNLTGGWTVAVTWGRGDVSEWDWKKCREVGLNVNKHEKTAQSKSWPMNGNFHLFFEEPVYFTIIIMFVTISTPRKTKKTLPLKNSRWKTILSFSKWSPF